MCKFRSANSHSEFAFAILYFMILKGFQTRLNLDFIAQKEILEKRIARGLNFYKMFWIFVFGSFFGVFVETLVFLVFKHELQVRSGLVYGTFNLIYGFGAVFMTLILYWFRKKSNFVLCFLGIIIGSIIEYAGSWIQEVVFHSESWNYSNIPFNLHGRINLFYSILWGLFSVAWIRWILPLISLAIIQIPNESIKTLTWIFFLFLVVNILVSVFAVSRWLSRESGLPAEKNLWKFIDKRFPDERMRILYPTLNFIN